MLLFGVFFCGRVSGHLAGGCLGSWRALPWFFAVAVQSWSRGSFFNHAPGCLTRFTCTKGFAPIWESCTDFHFPSIDDELTGPGYIDQLACEQKKRGWKFHLVAPFRLVAREYVHLDLEEDSSCLQLHESHEAFAPTLLEQKRRWEDGHGCNWHQGCLSNSD